jgi:DNA-binding transcriptional MerR regulator
MKHEYEINKALRDTGVTLDRIKKAFKENQLMLVSNFMFNLNRHLHGEAFGDVIASFKDTGIQAFASEESSGDPRVDKGLKEAGVSLEEAKRAAYEYHFGGGRSAKSDHANYLAVFRHLRRRMQADTINDITMEWAKQKDASVVTACSKWIRKNCKFAV